MTSVMFLGDAHGDRGFTKSAITWASNNAIDKIIQVGDLGFWPRTNNGKKFLHDVGKESAVCNVPFYFIDGNHEDHLVLDQLRARENDGFITYGKYPITYIDRGTSWEWGGVRFGAFGGAFSIDRKHRIEDSASYGWFRNEMPDESKIDALGKVDVLITHDAPIVPPIVYGLQHFKADETSALGQRAVYRALVATGAKLLVHGHWHLNERYGVHGATVQGLAMNQDSLYDAAVVYRTDDRRLFTLKQWEYRDE